MLAGPEVPPVHAWHHQVPAFLYKYFPPERFHVLTDCRIRFTQRHLFDDDREFRPEVRNFGTEEMLRGFMAADEVLSGLPQELRDAVVHRVLNKPGEQAHLIDIAQRKMKTPDFFVTLCLTEKPDNQSMWEAFADHGRGFVMEFDTRHPGFPLLVWPGRIGKVSYSDEPLHTFLGNYGPDAFFRKRTKYEFEAEWRCIKAITTFADVIRVDGTEPIYRSAFDPNCVSRILVRSDSPIEMKLRLFASVDCRYRHITVTSIP